MYSWITQDMYLCIESAPVIITDGAPLAINKHFNTAFTRGVPTHKTKGIGILSQRCVWKKNH